MENREKPLKINQLNEKLLQGDIHQEPLFPHVERLAKAPFVFTVDFGLDELPMEPGILLIRGARQYGKSTWLEQQVLHTIKTFGGGTAYYLNGDHIADADGLEDAIANLLPLFAEAAPVRRIFIDEITAIPAWEKALKRLVDSGVLESVLMITTGSKATDLTRGTERLPGRKGRLARSSYWFTPISYAEFSRVCGSTLDDYSLIMYLLSGGSPIACAELAANGVIPEFVIDLVRDWIEGEITATQRSRTALLNIMSALFRFGSAPVGQSKLARESGLANNTVAVGYTDILQDLGCVIPAYPWDQHRDMLILRKPCKYHFMNLLAAVAYHPARIRSVSDFLNLASTEQGVWYEWLLAQELSRRSAIRGDDILQPLAFWQNKAHEIDFVVSSDTLLEVKRGACQLSEFAWFARQFPNKKLLVVNAADFSAEQIVGMSFKDFFMH